VLGPQRFGQGPLRLSRIHIFSKFHLNFVESAQNQLPTKMARPKRTARNPKDARLPRGIISGKKSKETQLAQRKIASDSSDNKDTKFETKPPTTQPKNDAEDLVDTPQDSGMDGEHAVKKGPLKQKRDRNTFEANDAATATLQPVKKKYKSEKERRERPMADPLRDSEGAGDGFEPSIAQMNPSLLADHFAKTIKRVYKSDTDLELAERYLPSSTFMDTTSYTADRKKNVLFRFLEAVLPGSTHDLNRAAIEKASPHTIFVCPSGLRGADLVRELRTYQSADNAVAKLFAKHFKIEQQAVFLRKTRVGFGVGTPDRVKKLIEAGALKTERLERIVVDGSYLDEKKRGFWNMAELFMPMLDLLKMKEVQKKLEAGELQVIVF
jgi:protein CMS1